MEGEGLGGRLTGGIGWEFGSNECGQPALQLAGEVCLAFLGERKSEVPVCCVGGSRRQWKWDIVGRTPLSVILMCALVMRKPVFLTHGHRWQRHKSSKLYLGTSPALAGGHSYGQSLPCKESLIYTNKYHL